MLPILILLALTTSASVRTTILEKVGEADLEAVRIRLEEEKAKRLLVQNDVEVLMLQVEELKRALPGNVTFVMPSVAFTATLSKVTTHSPEQTVIFDNVWVNEGNCYDSSTGRFRAPFRELYSFSVTAQKATTTEVRLRIMKDNVEVGRVFSGVGSFDSGSVTVVTIMDKGQVAYVKEDPSFTETMQGFNWSTFTGLLHARHN